jgi:nuclear transport factor 2 (NTF2) superfamily protein
MTTDRLVFTDVHFRGRDYAQVTLPYSEPDVWPPPELLYLVPDRDGLIMVNPEVQSSGVIFELITEHNAVLYSRQSASLIAEPADESESWFRGALYHPTEFGERGFHEQSDPLSGDPG